MLLAATAAFFKYKAVANIIVLACCSSFDRIKYIQELNAHGLKVTVVTHLHNDLDCVDQRFIQGILCFEECQSVLENVKQHHFSSWYKWLLIKEDFSPPTLHLRHDSDVTLLSYAANFSRTDHENPKYWKESQLLFQEIFFHPKRGFSIKPMAYYSGNDGLKVVGKTDKIHELLNFNGYPLRLATPVGLYVPGRNKESFVEYLVENARPEVDSAIRCGHEAASLVIEALNATQVLIQTEIWSSYTENNSMAKMVHDGEADIAGGVLRMLPDRIRRFDYLMPIWPFSVGFTYVAERASSNRMFVEPFSAAVWWCCLATGALLAVALRVTSRNAMEKEGSFYSAVATCLQQDASAVPESATGRTVFLVLSISSMLIHGYYTSAVVSALMNTARGGPQTLRDLADSSMKIAAEDYEYIRRLFFNVKTDWLDMEYLKEKKMTSIFFQPIEKGVELIEKKATAYHAEYNGLYPLLARKLGDNDLCGLKHIDTIPQIMSYITGTRRSQFTNVMRIKGQWLHEVGLAAHTKARWRIQPPPCRETLLAEQVKMGDVAPLLVVTLGGVVLSVLILICEVLVAKWSKKRNITTNISNVNMLEDFVEDH